MTEEVKPVEKKKRAPKVISGDQHEVEAAIAAHAEAAAVIHAKAEKFVKAVIATATFTDGDEHLPANTRAEREAGRAALAKNVKR